MPASLALPQLERWFQARIHLPQEGIKTLPSPAPQTLLLPSAHLEAGQRLDLYSGMFFARMHDCLAEDYPTLRQQLGEDRFHTLLRGYLRANPSRHYSLNFLGRKMPEFLRHPRRLPRQTLLREIARVENAMSEVFDEREIAALGEKEFRAFAPQRWSKARLSLIPALRLLSLDYAVNDAISATRQERPAPRIPRRTQNLVVYRRDFRIWRMEIPGPAFAALQAIARGRTLAQAVEAFVRAWKGRKKDLSHQVTQAFSQWAREGFFASIQIQTSKQEKRS